MNWAKNHPFILGCIITFIAALVGLLFWHFFGAGPGTAMAVGTVGILGAAADQRRKEDRRVAEQVLKEEAELEAVEQAELARQAAADAQITQTTEQLPTVDWAAHEKEPPP